MKSIFSFFSYGKKHTSEESSQWSEAYEAFVEGKNKYQDEEYDEALSFFDKAIEHGYEDKVFELRGYCLHKLKYSLDAIDDFNKAISKSPDDVNLFYTRSLCKYDTGDLEGAISDCEKAAILSKNENALNREYEIYAKNLGYESAFDFFNIYKMNYVIDLEAEKEDLILYKDKPEFINQIQTKYNNKRRSINPKKY